MAGVLDLLGKGTVRKVVLDFHWTDSSGSAALGYFLKLWKRVRQGKGRLAFGCLSDREPDILEVAGPDRLWPVCASRGKRCRPSGVRLPSPALARRPLGWSVPGVRSRLACLKARPETVRKQTAAGWPAGGWLPTAAGCADVSQHPFLAEILSC
jgi:hypothetical protein